MSEQEGGLQGRLVVGAKRDGRRKYDESAKRELIQECLKPGVSIARTAMDHGINPNLVRTWISQYQREQGRVGVAGLAVGLSVGPRPRSLPSRRRPSRPSSSSRLLYCRRR
ncbi:transposase [Paraburkholderia sp. RL17-373-BIF-A]|uniref:transposase n=1 Tax=Paraburkholderia sp. RL17-373-BIF-A TaxID=3031629 RepID=UPI0038BBC908